MGTLFAIAKQHTELSLAQVERLLDHPAYEPRMAAMCILDFKARARPDAAERRKLYDVYLRHHDRITTWDMVDRAAPWVVGGHLTGRAKTPLRALARRPEPLRRRTAITAPLYFIKGGSDDDLADGFAIAALLASDEDPLVHKPVGIFLKHAGGRDGRALVAFLDQHATSMPRAAVRVAAEKLEPRLRRRYVG